MRLFTVAVLFSVLFHCEAKRFTKCRLVHELRRQGFPEDKLADWLCLIDRESLRTTKIISRPNTDGSRDHGLFQINDKDWCSTTSVPGKGCNITCRELLSNDITAASICAKKVFARDGFTAWYGWRYHCKESLPDISFC